MMRVRYITTSAGPGGVYMPGDERDVDEATARALVAGGYASVVATVADAAPVEVAPPVETAAMEAPETAAPISRANPPKKRFGRS